MRKPPNEALELSDDALPPRDTRGAQDEGHVPERTCILTRDHAPRADLIRLALGPDGQVAPDVRAKAPGRHHPGAWLTLLTR